MSGTPSTANATPSATPPGPANFARTTLTFQRSPLKFLTNLFSTYGDTVAFRLATAKIVAVNHPRDVKRVLQQNHANYNRTATAHKMARKLMGEGLPTAVGGPEWQRKRRLMQPSFHYQRVASMSEHMLAVINDTLQRWDAASARGDIIDTNVELRRLTLRIVARALFALEDEDKIVRFSDTVDAVNHELTAYMQFPLIPLSVPTAGHRRFWRNAHTIWDILDYVVTEHLERREDRGDLLSLLVDSVDEETGEPLSDRELRDEVWAMLFAGHETSANVLTWTWYRLGAHPDVQARVQQEVDKKLAGRPPSLVDCSKLIYTRSVLDEVQRLYPQQWQGWRSAVAEDELGGYRIPAGTDIFFSPYHMHRHPDFWPDAEEFEPARFSPEEVANRDRSCYMPFGAGPHICIGREFAMTEMLLIIASTIQRYRITLASSEPIEPRPLVTLNPARAVEVRLEPRTRMSG